MAMVNRPSATSDEQMAVEALRGDQEAFTNLYQQYFDQVYDLAARVLKDPAPAADVAQNVFMKFLGGTEVKPPQVSFRAWLYTMTRNAAIDELRRRQRLVPMAGSEMEDTVFNQGSSSAQDDPERVALDNELAALVWEAAQSLNPGDYTLLDLNIRKGLGPDELADALGISRGNVYTRLSRLRDSLEEAVTTLILARRGRPDCSQLNDLLLNFGSPEIVNLTPRSRRAVSRHIADCPICEANRRRYISASALFGGLTAVLPAAALKNEIWEGLLAQASAAPTPPQPPPPQPPPPSTPATVASEIVKNSAQLWSSLGAGVQTLVVGLVVVGAVGAAVATAILVPSFSSGSFPTISQFRLVDPDVGPDGISRNRELQVQLQVDEGSGANVQAITWLIREGSISQPSSQDPDWVSSPPSSYVLSPGDGPKSVDLWLKDQKDKIIHAAQSLVLLDTATPLDPSGAFSSSHQIGTPATNNLVTVQWEPAQDPEPGAALLVTQ
jgi:RNA polymerase sigma factor (sigma-70 family)